MLSNISFITLTLQTQNSLRHPNHSLSHSNTFTLSLKHPNHSLSPSNTLLLQTPKPSPETLTLLVTIPSLADTHSNTQTPSLYRKRSPHPYLHLDIQNPFSPYPFVKIPPCFSFQHPTNKSSDFFHRVPKFQF